MVSGLGGAPEWPNRRRHSVAVVGEEGRKRRIGAVLARVARREGRVGGGGASESIGGATQWLWPRWHRTAATGVFSGCVREREQRRGMSSRE